MSTDILFIHPGNHKKTYQSLANEYTAIATPVWTCLLAGYSRNQGYSTVIYDTNIEGWSVEQADELIKQHSPKLIVMMVYGHNPSASTQTMEAASVIASDIKSVAPDSLLAMGGLHPTALPEQTLSRENADIIIVGEGAYQIKNLMDYALGNLSLKNIQGICFKDVDGKVKTTPAEDIIEDLDTTLPDYAWDLLPDISLYRAHNSHTFQYFDESNTPDLGDVRSPYVVLYTSLGCPFNCNYCCINALFDKPRIRYWSLDIVMEWIDELVQKYNIKHLRLDDELFILSPKRVEQFCDMLIERGYDLNIWCYARVDTIKEKLLKKMKQAGINWLCLGIEAGNKDVRTNVAKEIDGDISDVVKMIQDAGIYVLGNYMFGLPEDTLETMEETLQMAIDLNCEFSNFYCTMAYPGSELYDYWVEKDPSVLPETWGGYSQLGYECKPLPTQHLSPEEVLKFRDDAFDKCFSSPDFLKMVKEKFGKRTYEHITKMVSHKLKRKLLGD